MKPAFARLSPTVPAMLAAAIGISLSVFLLPGLGLQGGPTPLLPAIGGPAGRVAADLPADERASEPVEKAASSAQIVVARTAYVVPQRRQAATKAHRVHRAPTGVLRRAPSAPVQVAASAAPATGAVTTRRSFGTPPTAKKKARGHGPSRTVKSSAGGTGPRAHGRGKALGHSSEHPHGLPSELAKKAPTASSPAATDPKANGGGNGLERGKR
jgi:hypothetical protein